MEENRQERNENDTATKSRQRAQQPCDNCAAKDKDREEFKVHRRIPDSSQRAYLLSGDYFTAR
ncbi:hypothetical protein GCM10011507_21140 [Edaphobacter acidisoli]|uniref:Uncharacterized protein n=1 Tax=Edaphobacter acidisoli TaxID=2040573 RepID=A0A916RWB6_9BACT|nr:hypothetical protein GCM10011507_21140 [Edaphobacter acidisoli]